MSQIIHSMSFLIQLSFHYSGRLISQPLRSLFSFCSIISRQTRTHSLLCIRAVINGKDLMSSCLCMRQFSFPYSFARINEWLLSKSMGVRRYGKTTLWPNHTPTISRPKV